MAHIFKCYLHRGSNSERLLFEVGVGGIAGVRVPLVVDLEDVLALGELAISFAELMPVSVLTKIPHSCVNTISIPRFVEL